MPYGCCLVWNFAFYVCLHMCLCVCRCMFACLFSGKCKLVTKISGEWNQICLLWNHEILLGFSVLLMVKYRTHEMKKRGLSLSSDCPLETIFMFVFSYFFFKSFFQPSYTNNLLVNSIQSTSRSYTSSTWIFVEISFRLVCFHLLYLDFWQNRQDILMRTNIWILLLNVIFCRI